MRLIAQTKMGYYPTPEAILPWLCACLQRSGPGLVRVLDPCAGQGQALWVIGEHLDAMTFGIELDQERGLAAQAVLDQCLIGDCLRAQVSNNLASLLLLNPPYDWDSGGGLEEKTERYERSFLRVSLKWLRPGGVLVYLIPETRLEAGIARMLSHHFQDIRVFRLPEDLYQRFKQVVILAAKTTRPRPNDETQGWLIALGSGQAEAPFLPTEPDWVYVVPPSLKLKPLVFRSAEIDPLALEREVRQHGLHERILRLLLPSEQSQSLKALMPLRHGHLAQLIACGLAGGVVTDQDGRNPLLVKGVTKKVVDHRVEYEPGKERQIDTERFVITVNAYDRRGRLITIA
jgi:tRNA1(Val) A37 N6-methylase TrmN6